MSALPEIPESLYEAAEIDPDERFAVQAAWPHLCAAAWRHAADQWEAEPDYYDGPYVADLRKWADEVTA